MKTERTYNKKPVIAVLCAVVGVMIGLVVYSPELYRAFCAATGAGGTVNRGTEQAVVPDAANKNNPLITVYFDANTAPGLKWDFKPLQRSVQVHAGDAVKIYYEARNNSDKTIVGRAVYNVTPYKVAPYFFKVQCFCFTDERLGPHQRAKMPVVFYVDKQFLKDKETQEVRQITLSYTFFDQKAQKAALVKAARDLQAGSQAEEAAISATGKSAFDNDAPRQ